jgi:hypothetical protein
MTVAELQHLRDVQRELRKLRKDFAEALKLRVQNALLVATNSRLIGENTALRKRLGIEA